MTQNSEIVEIRQKEAECELEAARDRVQQQATEILLKASKTVVPFSPPLFSQQLLYSFSPLLCSLLLFLPLFSFSPPLSLLASPPATTCLRFHMQTHQTNSQRSSALVSEVVALNALLALCCTSMLMSSRLLHKKEIH